MNFTNKTAFITGAARGIGKAIALSMGKHGANLILTDKGREVAQNVNDLVHLAVSQASAGYDTKKRETFTRVLNLIASNLQTICREGLHDEDDD